MADDTAMLELIKRHSESHSKYVYFLLAATGASLGYALQKIEGASFTWWTAPVVAALVSWLASFYCGCRLITATQTAISANYIELQLKSGVHPKQPDHPQLLQAALDGTGTAMKSSLSRASKYFDWQFGFLALGVVLFIAWRLLDMLKATFAA